MYGVGVERGVAVRFSLANYDAVLAIGKNGAVRDSFNRTLHDLLLRRRRGWRENEYAPALCSTAWAAGLPAGEELELTLTATDLVLLSTTFNFRVQAGWCQVRQKLHKLPGGRPVDAEKHLGLS